VDPINTLSITDELTDWTNLVQGSLGSVVGSVLGVLGAFWAARWTIKGQLESDRALARETGRLSAAKDAAVLVNQIERALLRMAAAAYFDESKLDEAGSSSPTRTTRCSTRGRSGLRLTAPTR
jgi:hypothetical protein